MKKLFVAAIVGVACLSVSITAFARSAENTILRFEMGSSTFTLDGKPQQMDVAPFIDTVYNRAMLPLRTIAEELGMTVSWTESSRTIVIERDGATVSLSVDTPLPDGMGMLQIVNDRTMVPIRYIAETLKVPVEWDDINNATVITAPHDTIITTASDGIDLDAFEHRIFELTNVERANYGLPPLIWDSALATAARDHSDDMGRNNFVEHIGSDGSTVDERLDRAGVLRWRGTENVAGGLNTPEEFVDGWMGSPAHREAILYSAWTHIGVGINYTPGSRFRFHGTQKFAFLIPPPSKLTTDEFERRLFELTNIERANNGVPPLIWHPDLAVTARAQSEDLARADLDVDIRSSILGIDELMKRAGVTHPGYVGRILITRRATPESTLAVWSNNTPESWLDIMNRDMAYIGIGYHHSEASREQFYTTIIILGH